MDLTEIRQLVVPPCPVLDIHVHQLGNFGPRRVSSVAEDAALLLAAIPALIAYNMYRSRIRILDVEMRNFALEITGRFEKVLY